MINSLIYLFIISLRRETYDENSWNDVTNFLYVDCRVEMFLFRCQQFDIKDQLLIVFPSRVLIFLF